MKKTLQRAAVAVAGATLAITGVVATPAEAATYEWRTFYENGESTLWANRGSYAQAHRWCLVSVSNRAAYHRWVGHRNVTITKNCAWNGDDAYVWQVRYQKRVLKGAV